MEPDFSGWATKAGLKCSDGRTIMPDAFKHQDKVKVPLVWQHGHSDPENVLGHVILEHRAEGVWCDAYFNNTGKAQHAREMVAHKDINALSIWANGLMEQAKRVMHGVIREVSLVLSGANPGALIENVIIRHGDGDTTELDDEIIVYTGEIKHAEGDDDDEEEDGETVKDIYDSMSDKQKNVVAYMIGEALESSGSAQHSAVELDDDASIEEVFESMTEHQREVVHFMIGEALQQSATSETTTEVQHTDVTKGNELMHNIFENSEKHEPAATLSHAEIKGIVEDATNYNGSLKKAVEAYALEHGITDIDVLFPEARALQDTPELFGRKVEWVNKLLSGVRKSPFSRIKTISADITVPEARAKGYIKGNLKKEEFFKVVKRITTPTTIYKKQKLDRDDMVDITDFDVVVWLKAEMRVMLDEELARAILVGDGRDSSDDDKIDEERIRPIASDHELYTTTIYVNINDANSKMTEVWDAITLNRKELRGTGLPTLYTTETYIARAMLQRDNLERRIYKSLDELATELRVAEIVPVEILEEYPDIVAILVNPSDYVVGATAGGQVSMFDDFDIDYNQHKYLIETRVAGALTKLKAALVVRRTAANSVAVAPTAPTFDPATGALTIVNTPGVVYRRTDTDEVVNAAGSPYTVDPGESLTIQATPAAGYHFETSEDDSWVVTANA